MNHFSSRGNVLAAILTAFLMIMAILLAQSCQKEDGNHKPIPTPEEIERGYTDLEDLRNKLSGEWVANINQEDPYDVVLIQYNFFGKDDSKFILFSANDIFEPGSGYDLDTVSIKWNLVEDYQGYSKAGVKGNAIEVLAPNDSTNYMVVKKIMQDSLYCTTAMGEYSTTIGFSKIKEPVNTSELRLPPVEESKAANGDMRTKATYYLDRWMNELDNSTLLRDMSLPGSHDAATYNVDEALQFAGATQSRDLGEQFDAGSRVFDLRIRADKNGHVGLYHNFVDCNMSLKEALEILVEKVNYYRSDGVIVILNPEDNDFADKAKNFSGALSWIIDFVIGCRLNFNEDRLNSGATESAATKVVLETIPKEMLLCCSDRPFREDLQLGDIRGKIAVFCRPEDENWAYTTQGAAPYFVSMKPFDENGKMHFRAADGTRHQADIYVQDNSGQGDNESESGWEESKRQDFKKALTQSAAENSRDKWFINFASGYVKDITPKFPNYATAAEDLYGYFIDELNRDKYHGIFFQDFVGDDEYCRVSAGSMIAIAASLILVPDGIIGRAMNLREKALSAELSLAKKIASNKKVNGAKLTNAIIANNYKHRVVVKTNGHGKVLIDGEEISEKLVEHGELVTLTAVPDEGYGLAKWDGLSAAAYNPGKWRVERDINTTACFETLTPITLYAKVDENSTGRGRVLINDREVSEIQIRENQEVRLYAEAFDGYAFSGWKDSNGREYHDNPLYAGGPHTYTASFGMKSSDDILLSSEIQVSEDGRKVRFTKGNLYFYKEPYSEGGYHFYDFQYVLPELAYYPEYDRIAYFFPSSIKDPEDWAYYWKGGNVWKTHVNRELFADYLISYNNKMLRTLTGEEWGFILDKSHSKFSSDNPVSYNKKIVNGHPSLVLFPANWTDEELFYAPTVDGEVWEEMERKGAVCLVINGYREYDHITMTPSIYGDTWYNCGYYLATFDNSTLEYIDLNNLHRQYGGSANIGGCVRLVYDVD